MLKNLKSTKNIIKSEAGVSLIEVLVAFGILAIIATGVASLMTGGMKQQKGMQAKDQQREITAEIRSLLGNKAACFNSFGGGNPTGPVGFPRTVIRDDALPAPGVVKYTVGLNDKSNMLKFDDFKVHSFDDDPSDPTQGTAILEVKLSKVGDVGTVKEIKPDLITLKVRRNGAGNIIECFSVGARDDSVWRTKVNLMDIYYNGGNVGIGTDVPTVRLQVMETISGLSTGLFIKSFHVPGLVAGSALNAYDADGTTVRVLALQSNGGNVGIGTGNPAAKLDVAGEVKIGNTGANCDTANAGAMKYVGTMIYCNGTAWTAMGGAPITRVASATVTAWRWASASISCNADEVVSGGGGSCTDPASNGFNFINYSVPTGNGWTISCDTPNHHDNTATVFAICMK